MAKKRGKGGLKMKGDSHGGKDHLHKMSGGGKRMK